MKKHVKQPKRALAMQGETVRVLGTQEIVTVVGGDVSNSCNPCTPVPTTAK